MNHDIVAERERRGWSVREAASRGGVSNETWGRYEKTHHLTLKMRVAVAKAFDWSTDWPEIGPRAPVDGSVDLSSRLDAIEAKLDAIQATRQEALHLVLARFQGVEERVGRLERRGERADG